MGTAANKIGRGMIKAANGIVDFIVLNIILLLIAVAVYALWDSEQVYQAANASQYALYKPDEQKESISFKELQVINPEVLGWLNIYGTNIDYPITQTTNNAKYVNTNAFGDYSLSGAIFLDYLNDQSFQDFNSILYGHHMEKQTMFGELDAFAGKDFFDSHIYGNLYYDSQDHGLEIFAFIKTDAYDDSIFAPRVMGEEAQQAYLQNLLQKAMYTREIGVSGEDHILVMTTCSSDTTNGRDILAARIADESFNNSFIGGEPVKTNQKFLVDQQESWESIPMWLLVLPVILLILLAILVYQTFRKKRQKE